MTPGKGGATMGNQSFLQKYIGKIFENLLLKNQQARKAETYVEAPWGSVDSNCSNHDPQGQGGATMGNQSFTQKYIGKIFENFLLKNHWARKTETYMEASWYSVDSKLFKS